MTNRTMRRIGFAACLGVLSCTPSTNVPGTELFLEAADGKYHGPMETLRVDAPAEMLEVAEQLTVTVAGVFEDGTVIDVGTHVYWSAEGGVTFADDPSNPAQVIVTGSAEGTGTISVQLGTLKASRALTVVPASLRTLEISGTADVARGGAGQLIVTGTFGDASTQELTEMATWTSSDEAILNVTDKGVLIGVGLGTANVSAKIDDIVAADFAVTVTCVYPEDAAAAVRIGGIFPKTTWTNAVFPGPEQKAFDLEAVYCQEGEYEGVKTLFFQISAEWCGPCKVWRRNFNNDRGMFDDNNSVFVVTEIEDVSGVANVTSEHANASIRQELGDDWGIRLGDVETTPTRNLFNTSNTASNRIITAFPTLMVVRTRDMKVIASSTDDLGLFADKMEEILQNPDWDWTDLNNPQPQFVSNCTAGQDEEFEPNDTSSLAKEIGEGAYAGGICTEAPDYYRVTMDGAWRLTLQHENAVGDLDVYVWDETTNAPMMRGNFPVGAYTNQDIESFDHTGPALIRIEGKGTASASYNLFVQAQ